VSAYPLNPVASAAQANVPIPEGLDLDKWIVPPPKSSLPTPATEEGRGRRPKKKKGKQKEVNGKVKEGPANRLLQEDALMPAAETEEEKAERERVGFISGPRWSPILTTHLQKRQERIERLKDDPYYIFDKMEIEKPPSSLDVDSIPIVRLDDLMPVAPGASHSTRTFVTAPFNSIVAPVRPETILRENTQPSAHQNREFVVDREGEMPAFANPSTSTLPAIQSTFPNPNEFRQSMSSTPVSVASFRVHDVGVDGTPRSSSLDPIKVTRQKKGTTGKKKRTTKPEVTAN